MSYHSATDPLKLNNYIMIFINLSMSFVSVLLNKSFSKRCLIWTFIGACKRFSNFEQLSGLLSLSYPEIKLFSKFSRGY